MVWKKSAVIKPIILVFLLLTGSCGSRLVGEVTDTSRYQEILDSFGDYQPVSHFPETIPSDASDIHFFFAPNFLQGGNILQVRYQLPDRKIQESIKYYRSKAIRTYVGGDMGDHINIPDGLPSTYFYTQNTKELINRDGGFRQPFPDTFELFILDAYDASSPEYSWNHGYSYGVAIDKINHQIVYWYEDW